MNGWPIGGVAQRMPTAARLLRAASETRRNVIVCGTPSSVTVKSLAVSPSTGLPLLSFTVTVSTTSWVLAECELHGGPLPACCAGSVPSRRQNASGDPSHASEPQPQTLSQCCASRSPPAAGRTARWSTVVFQTGKVTWLSGVGRRRPADRDSSGRPGGRCVQMEAFSVNCDGPGDGIAPRIAPLARERAPRTRRDSEIRPAGPRKAARRCNPAGCSR